MGQLKDAGLIKTNQTKTDARFSGLFPKQTFRTVEYATPVDYVRTYMDKYSEWVEKSKRKAKGKKKDAGKQNYNSSNGLMFEAVIATLLIREEITPFYYQAKLSFVPAIEYDIILYREEIFKNPFTKQNDIRRTPISISLKTSLRERWKQADLEAEALKRVHRGAKCFLVSQEENEVENVNIRIQNGDAVGIDKAIYCYSDEFNEFIRNLHDLQPFTESLANVSVVDSDNLIQ